MQRSHARAGVARRWRCVALEHGRYSGRAATHDREVQRSVPVRIYRIYIHFPRSKQELQYLAVPAVGGEVERGRLECVLWVSLSSRLQESGNDRRMAKLRTLTTEG